MKGFTVPAIFKVVDDFTKPMKNMQAQVGEFAHKMNNASKKAFQVAAVTGVAAAAILAPIGVAANEAIKFEDRMADVAKTTGLSGKVLDSLGDSIISLSKNTRTSIEDLQKTAEIGGALGITSAVGIIAFTDSVNKFNVALGSDFGGGVEEATRAIGGLNVLFKETRKLEIAESITRAGSALNALSAKGVRVAEITEFTKRIGALPDAIKPSIQETTALGAVFNKAGISAEIASRSIADILITAAKNLPAYAKHLGLSEKATKALLNTNPSEFLKKFAVSMQGLDAVKTASLTDKLKLSDSGSLKTIGTLTSSLEMLTEFQEIANSEFAKGTSLLDEYNTKNNTTAARLLQAKNNFEALSITIGTQLLPVISKLIDKIMPVIQGAVDWARENKELAKGLLLVVGGVGSMLMFISAVSSIIGIVTKAIWLWRAALWAKTIAMNFSAIAMIAISKATWLWEMAQWAINAALTANPIGLIIVGVAALIALIALVIAKWDEWGAAVSLFMGPLGLVIGLVQSFRKNWHLVTKAFKTDGILGAIKAIGKVLLDVILAPLQQILEITAAVTGFDWAKDAANSIAQFRESMGIEAKADADLTKEERLARYDNNDVAFPARVLPEVNIQSEKDKAYSDQLMKVLNTKNLMEVKITTDKGASAEVTKKTDGIKPNVSQSIGGG